MESGETIEKKGWNGGDQKVRFDRRRRWDRFFGEKNVS